MRAIPIELLIEQLKALAASSPGRRVYTDHFYPIRRVDIDKDGDIILR